jgi:hypothetical protein
MISKRLADCLHSPKIQAMLDIICSVIDTDPRFTGPENLSESADYMINMAEAGLRRDEDTDKLVNAEYFQWLFNYLKNDAQ